VLREPEPAAEVAVVEADVTVLAVVVAVAEPQQPAKEMLVALVLLTQVPAAVALVAKP
jgi:hypothetical protein